jgi:hypothetical protein
MNKKLALLLSIALLFLTSCDKDNDEDSKVVVLLNQTAINYDSTNVWTDALKAGTNIVSQNVKFSHDAVPDWNTWSGFVATRNKDVTDYSTGNWLEHQFTCMSGGGTSGKGTPYLVAYWNSSEGSTPTLAKASCNFTYGDNQEFTPISVNLNNTTYTYYAVINGTAYSKKFASGDSLVVHAYGVTKNGTVTGPVDAYLADYRSGTPKVIKDWTYFNLEALGKVVGVYFTMDSSDKGTWGINTPTYFAIDQVIIDTK